VVYRRESLSSSMPTKWGAVSIFRRNREGVKRTDAWVTSYPTEMASRACGKHLESGGRFALALNADARLDWLERAHSPMVRPVPSSALPFRLSFANGPQEPARGPNGASHREPKASISLPTAPRPSGLFVDWSLSWVRVANDELPRQIRSLAICALRDSFARECVREFVPGANGALSQSRLPRIYWLGHRLRARGHEPREASRRRSTFSGNRWGSFNSHRSSVAFGGH
jgi:hypothetical protein